LIVIDASAALELLLASPTGARVAERAFSDAETLCAPHLIDLEVAQVLRRYTLSGDLEPSRAAEALRDYLDLPIERYPHDLFLTRIWQMRHNVTAYDAAYIVLAEALDAVLLTTDVRLASASGHDAQVEVV
jgi:predicted nucleic acid-binding protein